MNKKTLFLFLVILFVLPMFVSANPFWDLITGNAVSNTRPTAQITTSSLGYGKQAITATVSDSNGDLQSAYISIKSSYFRYRIYKKAMSCSGTGYTKKCTYTVNVNKAWGNYARVYVMGRDRYGYGRSAYKSIRINPTTPPSPSPSACKDSDGGKVYTAKGTVTYNGRNYVDYCYSSTYLKEYYCYNNRERYTYQKCSKCVNGACIETPPPPPPTPPSPSTCKDSDGGKNIYVKGSVSSSAGVQTDYCSGNSLIEYYCSGNRVVKSTNYCKYGCSNGACLRSPITTSCKDSDGGKVYTVKGTVTYNGKKYVDYCYSSTVLKEYYCSNNRMSYTYHKCGKCVNGACFNVTPPSPSTCKDSDGGKKYFVKGSVDSGNGIYVTHSTDYCTGNSLTEYYCSANGLASTKYYCKYGCSDGTCLSTPSTCIKEGMIGFSFKQNECCAGLKSIPHSSLNNGICMQPRDGSFVCAKCGNGQCGLGENTCNCPTDCKTVKCVAEGGSIPVIANPPSCCAGLKLIKPISPNLVGSSGICTAKCGDGYCNTKIESNYNCPSDCKSTLPVLSCNDSDGGKVYTVKGSVNTYFSGIASHSTDYCSGKYLIEYYCSDNGAAKETHFCKDGCSNGACKTVNYECKAGEWKCDSNWPKYAYGCDNGKWVNIGMVPPAPPNGKWSCDKQTGKLTIDYLKSNVEEQLIKESAYCNYNNNPWKCNGASWPGNAYFCINHKWVKIGIPPAPPSSEYKCENGNVKIIAQQ